MGHRSVVVWWPIWLVSGRLVYTLLIQVTIIHPGIASRRASECSLSVAVVWGECSTRFTQSRGLACLGCCLSPKPNLGAFRVLTGPHWSVFSPSPVESALERIYKDISCSSQQHLLPHLTSRYSVTSSLAIMSAQASVTITRNVATTKLLARVPPPAFSQATHRSRCLAQLRSKHDNLEKYIYLNGLKDRDLSLFYSLLFDNMRESTPRLLLIDVSYIVLAVHRKWSQYFTPQL